MKVDRNVNIVCIEQNSNLNVIILTSSTFLQSVRFVLLLLFLRHFGHVVGEVVPESKLEFKYKRVPNCIN